jgi:hypothetical protein
LHDLKWQWTVGGAEVTNVLANCISPFASVAFAVNTVSDRVTAFSIYAMTGALIEVGSEALAGVAPASITVLGGTH